MKTIDEVLKEFPPEERFSLAILQALQREYGYISADSLTQAAGYLDVPISQLFSMATFYKALSLQKKGKIILKICDGTACHIRGSQSILNEIQRALRINAGETTEDGLFSLETVNCVGSCAIAPVVVCGETFHGNMTPQKARELLDGETSAEKEANT
ncbi:NAD(P)H-dependent oxidoreductase subunit E [Anaerovorax odorimutans]|uniref:NAD(P)H-dependent oxidoreductase subunit E n=2 Tax=Anaerovorax odorimutans TaxID=109327 RepID=A0ABT1RKW1_9FIRM|nr:NAD(P)H-dependent oxidoreductase subunit E [Anaerovorax odorimutans]